MRVCIAGGGIGGLTLALMLHQRGIDCEVLEAANEVRPLGVGINILPHCVAILSELGLLAELDRIAIRTRTLTYANHLGQNIWSELRGAHAGHAVPQFSIHRGFLHELLWDTARERLGSHAVRAAHRLTSFEQNDDQVRVELDRERREDHTYDALVGADGIHSTVRAILHGKSSGVRWTGIQMWRGAAEWPRFENGDAMFVAGNATTKAIVYPIAHGSRPDTRLTNWVITQRLANAGAALPSRESWNSPANISELSSALEQLCLPWLDLPALAKATQAIYRFPMCDRDPLPWWTRTRVTLLGDAAHPMYPVGSNGAAQALLDAKCLADLLAEADCVEALRRYEAQRLPLTNQVVASNRVGGPEQVLDVVADRAPDGFRRLDDVVSQPELETIVGGYAMIAGFAVRPPVMAHRDTVST